MKIIYTIKPEDIYWEMNWGEYKNDDGSKRYPDKPDIETEFEVEFALAHLLINGVVFINNYWWKKEWSEEARKATVLGVNANDVFSGVLLMQRR